MDAVFGKAVSPFIRYVGSRDWERMLEGEFTTVVIDQGQPQPEIKANIYDPTEASEPLSVPIRSGSLKTEYFIGWQRVRKLSTSEGVNPAILCNTS